MMSNGSRKILLSRANPKTRESGKIESEHTQPRPRSGIPVPVRNSSTFTAPASTSSKRGILETSPSLIKFLSNTGDNIQSSSKPCMMPMSEDPEGILHTSPSFKKLITEEDPSTVDSAKVQLVNGKFLQKNQPSKNKERYKQRGKNRKIIQKHTGCSELLSVEPPTSSSIYFDTNETQNSAFNIIEQIVSKMSKEVEQGLLLERNTSEQTKSFLVEEVTKTPPDVFKEEELRVDTEGIGSMDLPINLKQLTGEKAGLVLRPNLSSYFIKKSKLIQTELEMSPFIDSGLKGTLRITNKSLHSITYRIRASIPARYEVKGDSIGSLPIGGEVNIAIRTNPMKKFLMRQFIFDRLIVKAAPLTTHIDNVPALVAFWNKKSKHRLEKDKYGSPVSKVRSDERFCLNSNQKLMTLTQSCPLTPREKTHKHRFQLNNESEGTTNGYHIITSYQEDWCTILSGFWLSAMFIVAIIYFTYIKESMDPLKWMTY